MGVERANCWTLAEALGHSGPHRLQHFLARAVWDHDAVRDRLARWTVGRLADDRAVLTPPASCFLSVERRIRR
ncbi:transposase [Actinacidiphila sp. bgisy167]|uniref:transposase n=1 Tax=Actinacidiphila sp. bgisy167 TaxID=3413797 RepID=UPI003D70ECC4